MGRYYLAVDIGASGGRHILGELKNGKLVLTEIYRFENGMERKNGKLCWNTEHLFSEIRNGLRKCAESGKKPFSMKCSIWTELNFLKRLPGIVVVVKEDCIRYN